MEAKMVSGKLTVGDAATHVECGFIPDEIQLISDLGGTEKHYKFMKVLYDHAVAGTGKFGYDIDVAPTNLASANAGFIPYETSVESVVLPAPDGDGYMKAPSIADFDAGATYTARSITALGSVVRPTVHNGFVYELVTASGIGAEPDTWPTKIGETVTAGGNDVFITREERVVRTGVQGFTIGVDLCTNGEFWFFKAELHDRHNYMGDADVENPVTFGDHMR